MIAQTREAIAPSFLPMPARQERPGASSVRRVGGSEVLEHHALFARNANHDEHDAGHQEAEPGQPVP